LPSPHWRQSCKKATYLLPIMPQMICRKVVFLNGFSGHRPGGAASADDMLRLRKVLGPAIGRLWDYIKRGAGLLARRVGIIANDDRR